MSKVASAGWRYARSGPIGQVLALEKFDLTPAKDEAVVQVLTAPLHRVDAAVVNGTALGRKRVNMAAFPRIGGCEGVGRVLHVPAAASGGAASLVKEGDTVWIAPVHGTWATNITVPVTQLHKIDTSKQQLATTATNFLIAQQLLEGFARLHKGDVVIQNGGSSLTSLAVSALAKEYGVRVLTAATPGERFAEAKARHAKYGTEVFEYNGAGARAMRSAVGKHGAALYLNGVGGRYFDSLLKCVGPMSHVVTYGAQNGFGLFISGSNLIYNEVTMAGLFAPTYLDSLSYGERQTKLDFVLKAIAQAGLTYPMVTAPSLEKLPDVWDDVYVRGGRKGIVAVSK
ncbi:putative mitochondrial nuclear receptor binding factor-like protein [Leptomonas pyrrhocoris]|uniref:Putative mitochondrial nuclear receptor binding factor-like protein n=1 Tax=Leptomonas pyrrhocoris TaxID=157538 RepID=A0A0M9G266_LEPPY|nr:putative mitochondrial nuclear receptor binding factor-like protein [Leptomonas pyrrhocoris]XP_015659265.1 putative mitochondrial nuclear receptor binding factor-like protein [Leptomonas pyrrhocoris]KPA80825.1 putative mitochondrial nuclear receptor binding factor-like protein [Leptomonas pyrrhocoris]KPA80826.1 putative mitochondrial nuclear receptor binding factor-like protein [Leptomonas pyrrhocoris]|eukprot:XP_015659264.1 putative mitochondrial nuclear receptor binding factor-like protein [Leptomonas pyrrhocoris]